VLGGIISPTAGTVQFSNESGGGSPRPPRGTLGIVPQKNILFDDLTCLQNLRLWSAVKWDGKTRIKEDLKLLLKDCDLGSKIYAKAGTLSGGQKRKLQLAIGLVGGSKRSYCLKAI
jgi:ATP-binding cassette, subfamily A (ABC1), member 3